MFPNVSEHPETFWDDVECSRIFLNVREISKGGQQHTLKVNTGAMIIDEATSPYNFLDCTGNHF